MNVLCKLGFHKLDLDKARVINVWGDCWVDCKRCYCTEVVSSELISSYLNLKIIREIGTHNE